MKARHLLTTIGMAALMLSSGDAYAQNKMTIGFSQVGSESGWRAAETKVSKIEAEKRGVDLKISDAQQKQETRSAPSGRSSRRVWTPSSSRRSYRPVGTPS